MDDFIPQRTSAYISQHDEHIGEMTVRETLAFSARCQGVGPRYGQSKIPTNFFIYIAVWSLASLNPLIFMG